MQIKIDTMIQGTFAGPSWTSRMPKVIYGISQAFYQEHIVPQVNELTTGPLRLPNVSIDSCLN